MPDKGMVPGPVDLARKWNSRDLAPSVNTALLLSGCSTSALQTEISIKEVLNIPSAPLRC
ncbi:MAG: hypothetical protein SPF70_03370 [Lachnospiraceae bacterium]|nr:hypothetical protein [Lachnospiraceae bacterium]